MSAFVGVVSASAIIASTLEIPNASPTGSNRLLVVSGGISGATVSTLTSITFGATTVGVANWNFVGAQFTRSFCRHLIAPTAESRTVTITMSVTTDELLAGAMWFTGVDQTTATDNVATDTSNANTNCDITVTSATGSIAFSGAYTIWGGELIEDGTGTQRWSILNVNNYADGSATTAAGATSVSMSYAAAMAPTYTEWTIGGMNIRDVGGAVDSLLPTQPWFNRTPHIRM